MMRHLYIIVDSSECMNLQDLKPTRYRCVLKLLEGFIQEFFDLNPISQLGIISTKMKRSEKVTDLAGNQKKHIEVIHSPQPYYKLLYFSKRNIYLSGPGFEKTY